MAARSAELRRSKQPPHRVEEPSERAALPVFISLVDQYERQSTLARRTKFFGQPVASLAHELRTGEAGAGERSVCARSADPARQCDIAHPTRQTARVSDGGAYARACHTLRVSDESDRKAACSRFGSGAHRVFVQVKDHVRRLSRPGHFDVCRGGASCVAA